MKVKTADLIGPALDWAVATAYGLSVVTVTVEDQAIAHERVLRDHYSDAELQEHLIKWNKHARPTLRTRLAVLDSEGFPNGNPFMQNGRGVPLAFSREWSQAGPIMDKEGIYFAPLPDKGIRAFRFINGEYLNLTDCWGENITRCVVAMRCFVASRLGDEVNIPEELLT